MIGHPQGWRLGFIANATLNFLPKQVANWSVQIAMRVLLAVGVFVLSYLTWVEACIPTWSGVASM